MNTKIVGPDGIFPSRFVIVLSVLILAHCVLTIYNVATRKVCQPPAPQPSIQLPIDFIGDKIEKLSGVCQILQITKMGKDWEVKGTDKSGESLKSARIVAPTLSGALSRTLDIMDTKPKVDVPKK